MSFPSKHFRSTVSATAALLLLSTTPLAAQDDASGDPEHVTVTGLVVDRVTGATIPTTVVRLAATDRTVMTDRNGRFSMSRVPVGSGTLVFDQLGYTQLSVTDVFGPGQAELVVELSPQPVVLEGLGVMVDRLERRRRGTAVAVRVLEAEDFQAAPQNLFEAVRLRTGLTPCSSGASLTNWCVFSRGRYVAPSLWIDDRRSFGLEELDLYSTDEVYAVELYQSGRAIRVYTRYYMQDVAMSPRPVAPFWFR